MSMQLTPDFTPKHQREQRPIVQTEAWLDVSDIARGAGFTVIVQVSVNLNEALQPLQYEIDGDYDQRLYDALWVAHFKLSLDQSPSATFNFTFPRRDCKTEKVSEISLRMRVEVQKQVVLLGLLEDFSEVYF
ncbi:MAG TPA: hypothetical protein VFR47_12915 [Anaerolineales bacterium]|nr:hypothetical protein [Anaerolineales bacterium]